MSTPSRKRRKAREWMQKQREAEKEAVARAKDEARKSEARYWQHKLELVIPPDDNRYYDDQTIYPLGKPEHIDIIIPWSRDRFPSAIREYDPSMMYGFASRAHMRAIQMGYRLPNGQNIMWWNWEVRV